MSHKSFIENIKELSENLQDNKLQPIKRKRIIVYSDIVDSTIMALRLRSDLMRKCFIGLIGGHHNIISEALETFKLSKKKAYIGNMWGDGIVLSFENLKDAISVVFKIRELIGSEDVKDCLSEYISSEPIVLRFGIHTSKYFDLPKDWEKGSIVGKGKPQEMIDLDIHLAQKIQNEAPRHGIYVSDVTLYSIRKIKVLLLRKPIVDWKPLPMKIRGEQYYIKHKITAQTLLRKLIKRKGHRKVKRQLFSELLSNIPFSHIYQIEQKKVVKELKNRRK